MSHPLRVRGLKLLDGDDQVITGGVSHPLRVRGLKQHLIIGYIDA